MVINYIAVYTPLLFSLLALSSASPLDVRISVSENERVENVELRFEANPRPPHHYPLYRSHQQTFIPHRGSYQAIPHPRVPSDNANFHGPPPSPGYRQPFIPQMENIRPLHNHFQSDHGKGPTREEERPTSDTRVLHLDFGITAPWVLPLRPPALPKTPLPRTNATFTTIRCTNTSFTEDVFCDLRTLIPEDINDVITKLYYVLLRFPHPYLERTNCTALLQPRNANNYDEEDEAKKEEDEEKEKKTAEGSKNGTDEVKMLKTDEDKDDDAEKRKATENIDDDESEEDDESDEDDDYEDDDDEDEEDEDGEGEESDEEDRKKREGMKWHRKKEDPLHIFYDRSTCKPTVSRVVTPIVTMEDVTHMEVHFFGKEFTYLAKLKRDTRRSVTNPTGRTSRFPLLFTVDSYIYVSPVSEGSQEVECRSDGNRCRP